MKHTFLDNVYINDASRQNLVQLHQEPQHILFTHIHTQTKQYAQHKPKLCFQTFNILPAKTFQKRFYLSPKYMFADFRRPLHMYKLDNCIWTLFHIKSFSFVSSSIEHLFLQNANKRFKFFIALVHILICKYYEN